MDTRLADGATAGDLVTVAGPDRTAERSTSLILRMDRPFCGIQLSPLARGES